MSRGGGAWGEWPGWAGSAALANRLGRHLGRHRAVSARREGSHTCVCSWVAFLSLDRSEHLAYSFLHSLPVGSLQPSRTTEFLAYLGQRRRRAAAEPEEALRGLQTEAGGSPQRGVETRLTRQAPCHSGMVRDLWTDQQQGSPLRGLLSCPVT